MPTSGKDRPTMDFSRFEPLEGAGLTGTLQGVRKSKPVDWVGREARHAEALAQYDALLAEQRDARIRIEEQKWEDTIPPRWVNAKLADFQAQQQGVYGAGAALVRKFDPNVKQRNYAINRSQSSVIAYGLLGRGKTYFCYAIIHELIRRGWITLNQVSIVNDTRLASIAMAGFNRGALTGELLDPHTEIFFIDETGRGGQFGFGDNAIPNRESTWLEIVDYAYSNNKTIFTTTNLDLKSLGNYIGVAAFDRLKSMAKGQILRFDGKESRRQI